MRHHEKHAPFLFFPLSLSGRILLRLPVQPQQSHRAQRAQQHRNDVSWRSYGRQHATSARYLEG